MTARPYSPEQYEIISKWWSEHGWHSPTPELLSDTGIIIWQGLQPLASGFIYLTNSKFCVLEWVLSSKKSDKIERDKALDLLLDSLMNVAKINGKTTIFTSTQHSKLIERLKAKGFNVGDEQMTNLIRRIE